jgi:hypothetical protein
MGVVNNVIFGKTVAGTDTPLLSRLKQPSTGALITQSSVSAITYVIQDLTLATQIGSGTLTVASVVFNALQQSDARWTQDSATLLGSDGLYGYNFAWQVPGANFVFTPAYDLQGNPIAHLFKIDVKFVFADGSKLELDHRITVDPTLL